VLRGRGLLHRQRQLLAARGAGLLVGRRRGRDHQLRRQHLRRHRGARASTNHGRFHYQDWGDPGHRLVVPAVTPTRTGPHLVQVVYGNGAGPINTGITCAVKRVTVEDTGTGQVVASGVILMPHLGRWDTWGNSTFVRADLTAGRTLPRGAERRRRHRQHVGLRALRAIHRRHRRRWRRVRAGSTSPS
jgi:hypothetical protein